MPKRPTSPSDPPLASLDKPALERLIDKGKADPTAIRTLRRLTVAPGRFHQLSYIRNLPPQPVMEDEPEGSLGDDIAPNASEALFAAFGSCLAIGTHANGIARRIPIRSLALDLEADINTTAVWGTGDIEPKPIGFEAIRVSVQLTADASDDVLATLIGHATLCSPVDNTLHNPVHVDRARAPPPGFSKCA